MKAEKIEFWTYGSENGKAQIWFDKQTKYIEIDEKDLQCMLDWIQMDKDIDNAIATLKNAKNKKLKEKYKDYI